MPTRSIPSVVVRLAALFDDEFTSVVPDLGHVKKVSAEKTARLLGVRPRNQEEAVVVAGESMIARSLTAPGR